MKLNHPGIYRVIGEQFELLANIVGEVPCLRITSALLINDLVQKGKFTVLSEESIEIQTVCQKPDSFLFLEYEYSEICTLPPYRQSIRGTKMPNISNEQLKAFTNRYLEDIKIPGRGIEATKAYILSVTDFNLAQINVLMLKIINSTRYGHKLSHRISILKRMSYKIFSSKLETILVCILKNTESRN